MGNKQSRKKVLPSPPPRGMRQSNEVYGSDSKSELVKNEEENPSEEVQNGGDIDIMNFEYPFECCVFEGGGAKGVAFVGAVRELERVGAWTNITRIAGTSAGAMTAAMAAIGYNSYELEHFVNVDMKQIVLDARFKYLTFLPYFIRNFGWHPGKRLLAWFEDHLQRSTGKNNLTFLELYKRTGKELCIVVCNVNQMDSEYCHPKTTPDMEIALAIRMSMSIPVVFQAVKHKGSLNTDLYVDGGLLCNYAIHAFDGWYLSMAKEDSFMRKLTPLSNLPKLFDKKVRFGKFNEKTIGFLLYAKHEQDLMKTELESRMKGVKQPRPDTELARIRTLEELEREKMQEEHFEVVEAVDKFMRALARNNLDQDADIDREELKNALEKNDSKFNKRHREILFGKNATVDQILDMMDIDKNGEISFQELVKFLEKKGVCLQSRFRGFERREIKGVMSYFTTLQDTLLVNVKRIFMEERDVERTIGINTDYIDTNDYAMEKADKKFLIEQGARATRAFLRRFIRQQRFPDDTETGEDDDAQPGDPREESGDVPSREHALPSHIPSTSLPAKHLEPIGSHRSKGMATSSLTRPPNILPPISHKSGAVAN